MCNGEGEYVCQNSQCRCQCAEEFPQCNCPITDIQIMEYTLANMAKSWAEAYKDLENSGREPNLVGWPQWPWAKPRKENYLTRIRTTVREYSVTPVLSRWREPSQPSSCHGVGTQSVSIEWHNESHNRVCGPKIYCLCCTQKTERVMPHGT